MEECQYPLEKHIFLFKQSKVTNSKFILIVSSKLYWTDQGTESGIPAKVAAADMDGMNPVTLFTNNLDHIEFLTVDIQENKLYWAVTGTGKVSFDSISSL